MAKYKSLLSVKPENSVKLQRILNHNSEKAASFHFARQVFQDDVVESLSFNGMANSHAGGEILKEQRKQVILQ